MVRWTPRLFGFSFVAAPPHGRERFLLYLIVFIILLTSPSCGQGPASAMGARNENSSSVRIARSPQEELHLGNAYLKGSGVTKDPARAAIWYRKAADAGDPAAQNNLGYLYLTGTGIDRDEEQAAKWFARAIAGGSEQAKFNLALIYLKGPDRLRDTSLGIDLLNQLARKHNARAEDSLGVLYLTGNGVRQDLTAAEQWFSRSAKHGDPHGQYVMGAFNSVQPGHERNLPKALKFLRRSAHGGFTRAMFLLGFLIVQHPETSQKDPNEAVVMLTRAAEAGEWEASAMLGVLAREGRGMKPDPAKAFRWFLIESRQGGPEAEQNVRQDLASCRQALSSDQQDQELRAADEWLAQHGDRTVYVFRDGLVIPRRAVYLVEAGPQ